MSHAIVCDLMSALMKSPRTRKELSEMCLGSYSSQSVGLESLRAAGLIYIGAWKRSKPWADGRQDGAFWPVIYAQTTPFEFEDVPKPEASRRMHQAMARPPRSCAMGAAA